MGETERSFVIVGKSIWITNPKHRGSLKSIRGEVLAVCDGMDLYKQVNFEPGENRDPGRRAPTHFIS